MDKKVVLITGASNGIGAKIAEIFADSKYFVAINYNKSLKNANELANKIVKNGGNAICIKADVSKYDDCAELVNQTIKTFGHIDVLINNAAICSNNILIDETPDHICKIINTNLIGTINCTKAVCEHMIKRNFGKIINISSIWGQIGASGESVYSASKGGIISFTKAMAKELAYNNINVNCIAPGVVNTNMLNKFSEQELDNIKSEIPFGRLAEPEEIANLALFLSEKQSSYITGEVISINGGYGI